ncbi:MAG: N-acetyltransferase [marine bacterium B5-7]|nr:MAG: N-acetyltransferase [marine bacterium B5-7]
MIRRLNQDHAKPYRALMLEAYELHPDAFTSTVAERSALPEKWWSQRLSDDSSASELVMGAFVGNELAGVTGLTLETREKTRHKATLFGMYVPLKFRQYGFGRQLVNAVLHQARACPDIRILKLTVTEGNVAAQRLYESVGFVRFGLEPFAVRVGDSFVSKVHMW